MRHLFSCQILSHQGLFLDRRPEAFARFSRSGEEREVVETLRVLEESRVFRLAEIEEVLQVA